MTEPSESAAASGAEQNAIGQGNRTALNRALAWIGIVAGAVFVVAVVFFSGFFLNWSSGGHGDGHPMGPTSMSCCDQMKPGHPV
jgi:predicted phage tail protein